MTALTRLLVLSQPYFLPQGGNKNDDEVSEATWSEMEVDGDGLFTKWEAAAPPSHWTDSGWRFCSKMEASIATTTSLEID